VLATPAPVAEGPEVPKGPRVTDGELRAWYDVYRRFYTGALDTQDNAYASAKGMFPGKFVARDRVRALFPARKAGRKPIANPE